MLTRGDVVTRWVNGDDPGDQFTFLYGLAGTGKPQFFTTNGSAASTVGTAAGSGAMVVGQWHHLVATHDGTTGSCYLDGVLQGTATGTLNASPTTALRFGNNIYGDGAYTGSMSDVAIWSRCLSAADVARLYAESRLGYPSMLIRDRLKLVSQGQVFRPWYSPGYSGFLGTGAA